MAKKPVVLMILDGFGINDNPKANAVAAAKKPVLDGLMKDYPSRTLPGICARIQLPSPRRYDYTGKAIFIVKERSTTLTTSVFIVINVRRQMSVTRSSSAVSNVHPVLSVTSIVQTSLGNDVIVLIKLRMCAMAVRRS